MSGLNFYDLKKSDKNVVFNQLSIRYQIPAIAIEKDWWVVQTLRILLQMQVANHLVFKGGTSLSKSWGIINRFSEDIDLALDKTFLNVAECSTLKQVKQLRSVTRKYINEVFIPELQQKFIKNGFNEVIIIRDDTEGENLEPVQILIQYPSITIPSKYTKPVIKLEIGSRSLLEPSTICKISSMISDMYPDNFVNESLIFASVNPEKTLLEKLFLLHEEFGKNYNEIRVDRLSRHLYDIVMLLQKGYANKAFSDLTLYNEIVNHRSVYTKISGIDYTLHQPKTLTFIPPATIIKAWENDYVKMQSEMIFGESLNFDELIGIIKDLNLKINRLDFSF